MRIAKIPLAYALMIALVLLYAGIANAGGGCGGPAGGTGNPAAAIVAVAESESGANRLSEMMRQYESTLLQLQDAEARCAALSTDAEKAKCREDFISMQAQAKNILAKIQAQADTVEAKIAALKPKVTPAIQAKLDRVMATVDNVRSKARSASTAG